MKANIALGLMSGTSLDGVDAVAVEFDGTSQRLVGHTHIDFDEDLKATLYRLCLPGDNEIETMGDAAIRLARVYAESINVLLEQNSIARDRVIAAGVHGQTIRHRPERGWTLQLNNPALVAELSGVDVVADFRSRDMAAGGQGAPLVPAYHNAVFAGDSARAVVNIGGISNITVLPPKNSNEKVTGFDCGPGNMLMDAWCKKHTGRDFDENGSWAASGTAAPDLLARLLAEPYFSAPPPKSTGRELFNLVWLEKHLDGEKPADVQATLVELTSSGIAKAIEMFAGDATNLYVCGGGALNPVLMASLAKRLCGRATVEDTSALGIDPMHVEAMAFAWLAKAFSERVCGNLPAVTNASGGRILGALYPH